MAQAPSSAAAQAALAERTLMRRRLLPFVKRFEPAYKAGWVHELACRKLEAFSRAVADEKSPRLMLLMPPRSGKSRLASVRFPSWHLGQYPTHEYISAAYNISLPIGFSRHIRTLFDNPIYKALFPEAQLDPNVTAAEQWLLTMGGGYLAAGVGGGINGKGAHVLGIDDPIKNAEEADSATTRDAVWDWYGSTAYTRLAPGGGVLVIQTWWNDDDLAGRLQQMMADNRDDDDVDNFEVLKFPAIAEHDEWLTPTDTIWRESDDVAKPDGAQLLRSKGEALHPERYTLKALLKIKKTLEPRHWAALYQQNPIPDEGLYFSREMFRGLDDRLPGERDVRQAWDFAISEKDLAAYTVGATGCLDYEDNLEIFDVVRGKWGSYEIVENMLNQYEKHMDRHLEIGVEMGQIWLALKPMFLKRCAERRLYPVLKELKPITDKVARARPLQGRMQQGKVKFNMKAPWFEKLQHEFLRFPGGALKDQVDACAWLGQMCVGSAAPRPPAVKAKKSWKDKLRAYSDAGASHMSA
jgi:predicted phage terminase large subunit-like protein